MNDEHFMVNDLVEWKKSDDPDDNKVLEHLKNTCGEGPFLIKEVREASAHRQRVKLADRDGGFSCIFRKNQFIPGVWLTKAQPEPAN